MVFCSLGSSESHFLLANPLEGFLSSQSLSLREGRAEISQGHHLPMTDVNSSGAELPAAMNVAPATSSLRCRRYRGARTKHR